MTTPWTHLRRLSAGVWFRRLLSVRLGSQFADGVFQVALASYALFSDAQLSAASLAASLAVILLPFSVLGPFAGVFLDRWSRRQVLVWANLSRVGLAALAAVVVALGLPDVTFYAVALVALSVNRFLLAGLSAALPHTVVPADLVTANALTPTAGTVAFLLGVVTGGALRAVAGPAGVDRDATVLLTAAALYAGAGMLALRIPRDQLGPDEDPTRPAVAAALRHVLSGLRDGLRHVHRRPAAEAGLLAIGSHRYWFGIWTVALVLVFRNHLNPPTDPDAAFADLSLAAVVTGAGFLCAAVVTPVVTERLEPRHWIVVLLVLGSVVSVWPGGLFSRPALLVTVFVLGLVSQGVKICVDTLVQRSVDDAYRGRVFSLYDVIFNVAFVAATATAAAVLPRDGRSLAMAFAVSLGYLLTAMLYLHRDRAASAAQS